MSIASQLPNPSPDALAQSAALSALLRKAIIDAGGWLPFSRYMELALFTPRLGYYSGGSHKFGPEGDFITAPELTPLFGQALARQVAQITAASAPDVLEVGAGTGTLAVDILLALEVLNALPERYAILELSAELRERQQQAVRQRAPHLAHRVHWLNDMPAQFSGCLIANEVLDVMPVDRLVWRAEGIFERGVSLDVQQALCAADRPASGKLLAAAQSLALRPGDEDYVSELSLAAQAWIASWADRLQHGAMLLIDYGYPQAEYYLPARSSGTLQCYYRHRAHSELFLWPGLNDITSFVDFSAIAHAAHDAGLEVLAYTTQASFLHNCGLLSLLAERGPSESADYLRAAKAAQRLTAPHDMGELFKVLAVGKGELPNLLGFSRGDRLHSL